MRALIGGILGVLVVRYFILEPIEVMGWNMFWSGISEGAQPNFKQVLKSDTFIKCAIGFAVGGFLGSLSGRSKRDA